MLFKTAEDGFLEDILANPEDLDLRLIFADWLDKQSEKASPRAELIRIQVELFRTPEYTPRWRELFRTESNLLKAHKKSWTKPFQKKTLFQRFYRGFIEELTLNGKRFLEHGQDFAALTPLRRVKLSRIGTLVEGYIPLARIADSSNLLTVTELDLESGTFDDEDWQHFTDSKNVENLTWLNAGRTRIGNTPIRLLVNSPNTKKIHSLDLLDYAKIFHPPSDEEIDEFVSIFEETKRANLTELGLTGRGLDYDAVSRLARCRSLRNLRKLVLDENNNLDDDAVEAVCFGECMKQLRTFSFRRCGHSGDVALRAVADSDTLTELESLSLSIIPTGYHRRADPPENADEAMVAFCKSPNVSKLRYLDLECLILTDVAAQAILDSEPLANLGYLNLKGTAIGQDMKKALRKRFGTGVCSFSKL